MARRRAALLESKGFHCACPRCRAEGRRAREHGVALEAAAAPAPPGPALMPGEALPVGEPEAAEAAVARLFAAAEVAALPQLTPRTPCTLKFIHFFSTKGGAPYFPLISCVCPH